jgi:hypothetical protein
MPILGMRTTANFVTNQRPENWRETIMLLYPNSAEIGKAPLTALTSVMKERKVDDPVFHWWEKALNDRRFQVNVALGVTANGAAGTLTVNPAYNPTTGLKKGDLLMIEATKEVVRVSADPTANNTASILRGFNTGGTGLAMDPAVSGTNPFAVVIGSALEEGSDAPTGVNFDPNERNNYTQIFRSTLEMTRTATQTRLRTGDAVKEAKRECLEYFSVDMERGFFFGKKGSTTLNSKPLRMMSGVIEQISTNAGNILTADAAGGTDMDWIEANLKKIFSVGSSEKIAFGGNQALLTIQQIVRKNSVMNLTPIVEEYGMKVARLETAFGTLVLKSHPLFTQMVGGINTTAYYGMDSTLVIMDMAYVKYVYLNDVEYEKDLAQKGLDGMKSGYLAECSIELDHPGTHWIINNLAKPKKDA